MAKSEAPAMKISFKLAGRAKSEKPKHGNLQIVAGRVTVNLAD